MSSQTKPKKSIESSRKLVLLDAHAIIHRAYHALPDFVSSKGEPTGALYGLSTMLMALINNFKPDHLIAAFDLPKPTYRHEAYADYKSGRKKLDENLISQLQGARKLFKAFNIPVLECEGFEADDVIGTLVEKAKAQKNISVVIASGDMDTLQLVDDKRVQVFTLKKGIKDTIMYDETAVKNRFGFEPALLVDYKGLRGDPSDNIIGVQGIGEKTATTLIQEFGTIEDIYKQLKKDDTKFIKAGISPRMVGILKENEEEALFSKMLATIHRDVPIKLEMPEESWFQTISAQNLRQLFTELEFRSLIPRIGEMTGEEKATESAEHAAEALDPIEVKKIGVALWVLDSNHTNPDIQDILHYAKTDNFSKAREIILAELMKQGLQRVYHDIEVPLVPILEEMKVNGILINKKVLKDLSGEYHIKLDALQKNIWKLAGEEFNINSPKQMAEILFTKLALKYKGMRKTSSGSYSTKEDVLQKLAEEFEIVREIMKYRELQKLLSTYIDTIPTMVGSDSRLHPTFLQAGTTTGRMASADPNIQNIPIKSEYGRRIRNAFIAEKGYRLVAFDYSQIELRIAAILSEDKKLIEIFKSGRDVHSEVAASVFKVSSEEVTKEMRNKAKTINFGILYGMGVGALQKNLGTNREEAQTFYNDYFSTFTALADYLNKVKAETARKGYTETLFGRRRYFEGINSSLPFIKAQAERMAINAPIQGTQADLIKIAMVQIYNLIVKENLKGDVRPIMQIHDEVIYEIKEDLIEDIAKKVRKIMENVLTEDERKGIPIIANAASGKSWGEMMGV